MSQKWRLVIDRPNEIAGWVLQQIQYEHYPITTQSAVVGIMVDDEIVAGCIYHDFLQMAHGNECTVTVAVSPKWSMTPRAMRIFFAYPFLTWGCVRISACVHPDNGKSIDFVLRAGFKYEGRIRSRLGPGVDILIYSVLKEECRWLSKRFRTPYPEIIQQQAA